MSRCCAAVGIDSRLAQLVRGVDYMGTVRLPLSGESTVTACRSLGRVGGLGIPPVATSCCHRGTMSPSPGTDAGA